MGGDTLGACRMSTKQPQSNLVAHHIPLNAHQPPGRDEHHEKRLGNRLHAATNQGFAGGWVC